MDENYLKKELYELVKTDERIFDFIQDSSLDGLWYWDLEEPENEWMNARFWTILGYNPEEMPHKTSSWQNIINQDDLKQAFDNLKRHFENPDHPYNQIVRYTHKDGSTVWIRCRGLAIRDGDGKAIRMLGAHHDITEVKRSEQELSIKNEELKKINSEKDKFFSVLAHDLRSPYNAVIGCSDLLLSDVEAKNYEGIEEYARIIQQSAQLAVNQLDNLMKWAQSQTGRMVVSPEYFGLSILVHEVILLLGASAQQKSIDVSNNVSFDIQVYADKEMVSTVLRNLISNAIKFTPTNGKITIECNMINGDLTVSVSDTGVGIDTARIDKLFTIGEAASTKGTQNEKGTGLGLILCREFIEKNKGKIWAESSPGQGSLFHFSLPTDGDNDVETNIEKTESKRVSKIPQ